MDPGILFGSKETIERRVMDVINKARSKGTRCGLVFTFCTFELRTAGTK